MAIAESEIGINLIYIKSIKQTLAVCSKTKLEEIVYPKHKQTCIHTQTHGKFSHENHVVQLKAMNNFSTLLSVI